MGSAVYDNWERLVSATLRRVELRELALAPSRETSFSSSIADDFDFDLDFSNDFSYLEFEEFSGGHYFDKSIRIAEKVIEVADQTIVFKPECMLLKSKAEKIVRLLQAGIMEQVYTRPALRIMAKMELSLNKTLALLLKCRMDGGIVKRVFTIISTQDFRKLISMLQDSINDVSWLLRISSPADDYLGLISSPAHDYVFLPPIAFNDPVIGFVWQQIAILYTGSVTDRADAAASFISLARDNDRYRDMIIQEGGIVPLSKLVKEGDLDGQVNAAKAIGLLVTYPNIVKDMLHIGVCSVFAQILKESPTKAHATVLWAISELVTHHPESRDLFAKHDIIPLIFAFLEPEVEQLADTKTMAAKAIWYLVKGNSPICKSIEPSALLYFAVLLEKGQEEDMLYSAMALMEITAVAEEDAELRKAAFDPDSNSYKAVIDQLFKVIENGTDFELLVPCVKAIGNLACTFDANAERRISSLVKLLEEGSLFQLLEEELNEVSEEACLALSKFASPKNIYYFSHSKAIIDAGAVMPIQSLFYCKNHNTRMNGFILLCYLVIHVPHTKEFARENVQLHLNWARSKLSPFNINMRKLWDCATYTLELHQPGGCRGFP